MWGPRLCWSIGGDDFQYFRPKVAAQTADLDKDQNTKRQGKKSEYADLNITNLLGVIFLCSHLPEHVRKSGD